MIRQPIAAAWIATAILSTMMPLTSVSAAIIHKGSYALDTKTGLAFYNLTLTEGMSYNQVSALLSTKLKGYVFATASQVEGLFSDAGVTSFGYEISGFKSDITALAGAVGNTLAARNASQYVSGVTGYYGEAFDNGADVYVAGAMLTADGKATIGVGPNGLGGYVPTDFSSNTNPYGAFLVSANPPPGTVPLPSSAPMFGAALLALGVAGYGLKRKKIVV